MRAPLVYLFIAIAGMLQAVQTGANAELRRTLGTPWYSAMWVYFLGLAAFGLFCLVTRQPPPTWQQMAQVPWWAALGGVLGVGVIFGMLNFAGRVGAGPFMGILVTAVIVTSLALDHFGLVGFARHAAGPLRLLGGALMIGGVILIALS